MESNPHSEQQTEFPSESEAISSEAYLDDSSFSDTQESYSDDNLDTQSPQAELPKIDDAEILAVLQKYWGYDTFRPLQLEAMRSVINKQDSVVVLPTGGGKSLCYQVPALLREGLAIIVSPLIALMKDQVDALKECGIHAAAINSSLSSEERFQIANDVRNGKIKILYVAPERLCNERTLEFLSEQTISFIAVDEAHCISSWGHNFRPEYRIIGDLRNRFPDLDMHAYTATATEQVRDDISTQLKLESPEVLVGNFDRPNLTYRISRRDQLLKQVREVIDRHPDESGIIYCITRKQVEGLAADLNQCGYRVAAYHAGLDHNKRERAQNDFLNEKVDMVVATVAFGMGIDKSNVRYVIHASATKSLENYQQETGRAGRDGLPAECCLFYGGNDFFTWKKILSDLEGEAAEVAHGQLSLMNNYCASASCRHRHLVEHFGQDYSKDNCHACDTCLGELKEVEGAKIISQKILSCVHRVEERFGADYVASVLIGSKEQRLLDNNHNQLSTYGLLSEHKKKSVRDWIEQLVGQGCLERYGEYGTIRLTPIARKVFKDEFTPRLLQPAKSSKTSASKSSRPSQGDLGGPEGLLFEELRKLRRELAQDKGVPPFVVFGDVTLIDLAIKKPSSDQGFLNIHGVGGHKAEEYGERFMSCISAFCDEHQIETSSSPTANEKDTALDTKNDQEDSTLQLTKPAMQASELFQQGLTVEQVAESMKRAISTTSGYLADHIAFHRIQTPEPWVDDETFQRITKAAYSMDSDRLKPLFEALDEEVPYSHIRIAVACLKNLDWKQEESTPK
ncbi:MAG: DNA helicase RecQ [Planctomycetaceae bacterium]|nr:DNA helicase RecQ [Planctomycetaceae bacterium]